MAVADGSRAFELVASGQYDAIAPLIDNLELQVHLPLLQIDVLYVLAIDNCMRHADNIQS